MFYPYDLVTGMFIGTAFEVSPRSEEVIAAHTPEGCGLYEGEVDTLCHRIDLGTGELVAYQPPAPAETEAHSFDWDGRRWQPIPKAPVIAEQVRTERARLLAESDWVVTRAMERGEPVPADWLAYRQALRDVPQQSGFPLAIAWPECPDD